MNLRRYDVYIIEHVDECAYIEEEDCADGAHVSAFEALNIITVQKNRIAELEAELQKLCGG